jgi:Ca2+-binding RTX toxin-like protein
MNQKSNKGDCGDQNRIEEGTFNDFVTSAGGSGLLNGGAGNDYLSVANGIYTLEGGAGDDTFECAGFGSASYTAAPVPMSSPTGRRRNDGGERFQGWRRPHLSLGQSLLRQRAFREPDDCRQRGGAVISWSGMSEMVLNGISASQLGTRLRT